MKTSLQDLKLDVPRGTRKRDIMSYQMSYAAERRLKEIRREELWTDIAVLRREINRNKFTREENLKWLEVSKNELKELNQWLKDN